ncbi:MAG: hypothetical protein PHZ09_12650, partial [Eubacteriales bacterium]|nr:hypothetical protein [Eubacteriales bacterium]
MNINYSIESRGWDTDVCGYIQKHDLVFRTPVCDPLHGIPMGDGDTGTLLHIEPDALLININKTDLWNKSKNEDPVIHTDYSANVHGAVLKIDFGCPVFEDIYSRHYEARLALGNATAGIKAQTPFCDVDITAFASHDAGVTIIRGKTHYREKMSLDIILKRWGSRIFPYWYAAHYGSCEDGLDGTEARTDGNTLDIVQTLNGNAFCVSVKAVCCGICSVKNSRTAVCASKAASEHEFLLYISVGVNPDAEAAVEEAHAKINTACAGGFDALYSRHCAEWSEFWNKSFISLPKENDFIENLWYLNLYYANSEMRGKSPHHFTNGIWTNYHDFVPWNNIFHYNTQLSTFPLEAANHPELLETYYNYRISQLPAAREYAAKHKGKSGAFYTDVSDFMGRMQPQEFNCTCGAQIAMALYDHYRYSNDEMYLRRILP